MRFLLPLLLCWQLCACELFVEARNRTLTTAEEKAGKAARGMVVSVKEDGAPRGGREGLPRYAVIKLPGVSKAQVRKYLAQHLNGATLVNYRLWRIRWEDLPLAARNKLAADGELTIKVGAYAGPFDYTWTQVKGFFRNLATDQDETEEL